MQRKLQAVPILEENKLRFAFPALSWLLSSILFFFIASVVAPQFWHQLSLTMPGAKHLPVNRVFGFAGILVYFLEPITWHYNAFIRKEETKEPAQKDRSRQSKLSMFIEVVLSLVAGMLIAVPYIFLLIFKPVLRAIILYTSLMYLGNMDDKSPLYQFFVITVSIDVLLYYLNLAAPKWKYNPVLVLSGFIGLHQHRMIKFIAGLLLVIHTALIYTLLLNVVFYNAKAHPEKTQIETLFLWWFILTVYCRASFTNPDNGYVFSFLFMNRVQLLINILALVISFVGFIWPFYFG